MKLSRMAVLSLFLSLGLAGLVTTYASADDDKVAVGLFSANTLEDWEEESFEGETEYSLTKVDKDFVLKAMSNNSASGLFREITVDIKKYPYLNWRWRISKKLPSLNETVEEGDDYSARVYVVVSGGFFFWKTKALNYVWSSQPEIEKVWPNAFAPDNARMVSVRSSEDPSGTWLTEKRNVYEELKSWLGKEIDEIDAIAIMTDTDNSHLDAEAYYGDIFFSKE